VPLRVGKGSSYEGGVRVPAIVHWPGVTRAGSDCREPIVSPDFYPTILAMAGAQGHPTHNMHVDGMNLLPLLKDPAHRLNREAIYWHYPHYHPGGATPYGAVRAGDWRLVEFYEDGHADLYNLRDDIGERNNLALQMPKKTAELRQKLQMRRESVHAQLPTANPNYKP